MGAIMSDEQLETTLNNLTVPFSKYQSVWRSLELRSFSSRGYGPTRYSFPT